MISLNDLGIHRRKYYVSPFHCIQAQVYYEQSEWVIQSAIEYLVVVSVTGAAPARDTAYLHQIKCNTVTLHSRFITSDQTQYFLSIRATIQLYIRIAQFWCQFYLENWPVNHYLSDTSLKWGVLETSLNVSEYYLYRKLVVGKILR